MIELIEGRVLAGRYRLEHAMGRGGMGLVWVARHLRLETEVAIKFMAPAFVEQPEMRARFEREAKAAALLRSPHVVQVYDYGIEEDTPYIVMERLEGEDLLARIYRDGHLTPAATATIVVPLCKALKRAHEAGLVHRDLKPANVFLAQEGDEEVVKILDFGIVKAMGKVLPGLRTMGVFPMGSPHYMSPEQVIDGAMVDHRADLWSLGVLAFRCLTGKSLFSRISQLEFIAGLGPDKLPAASEVAPWLGPGADAFFDLALSRDPARRFQTAAEFAQAFVAVDWAPVTMGPQAAPNAGVAGDQREEDDTTTFVHPAAIEECDAPQPGATGEPDAAPTAVLGPTRMLPVRLSELAKWPICTVSRGSAGERDSADPVAVSDPLRPSLAEPAPGRRSRWLALTAATAALIAGVAISPAPVTGALHLSPPAAAARWGVDSDAPSRASSWAAPLPTFEPAPIVLVADDDARLDAQGPDAGAEPQPTASAPPPAVTGSSSSAAAPATR